MEKQPPKNIVGFMYVKNTNLQYKKKSIMLIKLCKTDNIFFLSFNFVSTTIFSAAAKTLLVSLSGFFE